MKREGRKGTSTNEENKRKKGTKGKQVIEKGKVTRNGKKERTRTE